MWQERQSSGGIPTEWFQTGGNGGGRSPLPKRYSNAQTGLPRLLPSRVHSCAHPHRIPHAKPRSSSHSIPTFHPPGRGEGPGRRRGGLRGVPARGVVRPSTIPLGGTRRTGPPDRPTGPPPPVWGTTAPGGPRRPDPPIPFFLLPFPTHMCLALWVHNGLQVLNSSLSQPQFASLVQTAGAWHRFSIFRHSMI